jgi:hypothetical protein
MSLTFLLEKKKNRSPNRLNFATKRIIKKKKAKIHSLFYE